MSLKSRFGMLEKRRPTQELPATTVSRRFETLGEDQRAQAAPPAHAIPVRETNETQEAFENAPRPPDRTRDLLAMILIGWAAARAASVFARIVAALLLLGVLLATGMLARGCAVMRGDYSWAAPSDDRR